MKKGLITIEWDFNYPKNDNLYLSSLQFDWNQTFITALNRLRAKTCLTSEKIILYVPNKFESIITGLYYYNRADNTISDIYVVNFIESDVDYIKFGGLGRIKIKNFKI